jgi:hypothetical protein
VYSLTSPTRNHWADYVQVCSRRRPSTQTILALISQDVSAAYGEYDLLCRNPPTGSAMSATPEQKHALKTNYDLLGENRPFHRMREYLMLRAPRGRCPMCGMRQAATLDHYLPKSPFPEYSVLLKNLVPCCYECNFSKKESVTGAGGERFFHPYYDIMPEECLLVADVSVTDTVIVTYAITDGGEADVELTKNLQYHFKRLDLGIHYQAETNSELFDRVGAFDRTFQAGGTPALTDSLRAEAESTRAERGTNNWRVALYDSLANSKDFCAGGYTKLVEDGSIALRN